MKYWNSFCSLVLVICFLGTSGCAKNKGEKKLMLPKEQAFIETTTWNQAMADAYLRPYWNTREIYNETVVFIGEEGEATLLFTPDTIHSVRNYGLDKSFQDGKDYIMEGNKIKRVKGGTAPYWNVDDYFLVQPNNPSAVIGINAKRVEFDFPEARYLRYGEMDTFTQKQLAVTYRHSVVFSGEVPQGQSEKLTGILEKLKNKETLKILVYGDSVAVGCNASGTPYGGNVSPHMPDAYTLVCDELSRRFDSKVVMENSAVGGWRVLDCLNNYDGHVRGKKVDLMLLRIGGNDGNSNEGKYVFELTKLLNKFFDEFPEANVLIQTPETANEQSTWVMNVGEVGKWTNQALKEMDGARSSRIAVAQVGDFVAWMGDLGKRDRDWLANNINHPNDFVIRLYAQMLLKTILGSDFTEEIYG